MLFMVMNTCCSEEDRRLCLGAGAAWYRWRDKYPRAGQPASAHPGFASSILTYKCSVLHAVPKLTRGCPQIRDLPTQPTQPAGTLRSQAAWLILEAPLLAAGQALLSDRACQLHQHDATQAARSLTVISLKGFVRGRHRSTTNRAHALQSGVL